MSNLSKSELVRGLASHSLISADELMPLLGNEAVKIFDVRGTWKTPARALPEDYEDGHIPGAVFLDWTKHLIEQDIAVGLAAVADEAGATQSFAALGINEGDLVVLYDDTSHMLAGRIWWAMRYWGFADVRVLNGGWKYWAAQNMPVSKDIPTTGQGSFKPSKETNLRIGLDKFVTEKEAACVIDGRSAEGFAGKADDPRTGHIPGSLNIPFSAVLDQDTGLFLGSDKLETIFDETAPQWRETPIITSCGAGYAATVILLALSQLQREASLFDGSFGLWKQDPDRPVAQLQT